MPGGFFYFHENKKSSNCKRLAKKLIDAIFIDAVAVTLT